MYYKKVSYYIICIAFVSVFFVQCKNDDEDKPQPPQITYFEVGSDNSATVNLGDTLEIKATISAEAGVDKIRVEIKPEGTSLWAFDTTYLEYSAMKDITFNQSVNIPIDADSGLYTLIFSVSDLQGQQTFQEEQIQLIYLEMPIIIPFDVINGFIIDNEGSKLLATDKGVFFLNISSQEYVLISENADFIPANDLALSQLGDLWITSNQGVLNFKSQLHLNTENSELLNNLVNRINIDKNDIIYFGTTDGISIKNEGEWLTNLGLNDLYSKYPITDIATASNGYTYATTNGGGVERFKVDVDGISGATVFDTDWSKLKSDTVLTVFIDDTVQAYGTNKGVAMHFSEYTKWDWVNYTTEQGLINDTVLSVIKDKSGNWWFGTIHGLSKLEGSTWTNYTVETAGIISNTIKFMAIDNDGSLWFATDKGLSHFINNQCINY